MDIPEKPTAAIRCDACPVLCYINPGRTGACDRYANDNGQLVRIDPHVVLDRAVSRGESGGPFWNRDREWDGSIVYWPGEFRRPPLAPALLYPDYKPAPFIISSSVQGVDMVTVVYRRNLQLLRRQGEDRYRSPSGRGERILVRAQGER